MGRLKREFKNYERSRCQAFLVPPECPCIAIDELLRICVDGTDTLVHIVGARCKVLRGTALADANVVGGLPTATVMVLNPTSTRKALNRSSHERSTAESAPISLKWFTAPSQPMTAIASAGRCTDTSPSGRTNSQRHRGVRQRSARTEAREQGRETHVQMARAQQVLHHLLPPMGSRPATTPEELRVVRGSRDQSNCLVRVHPLAMVDCRLPPAN